MGRDARANIRSFQRPSLPIEVKDALGRPLRVGDRIMLTQTGVASWRIAEIAPELAAGAPANIVRVRLESHQTAHYEATGVSPMILILPVGDNPFEQAGEGEPPAASNGQGEG